MQGWFNILKPIRVTHHSHGLTKKIHMMFSMDEQKHLTKFNTTHGKNS